MRLTASCSKDLREFASFEESTDTQIDASKPESEPASTGFSQAVGIQPSQSFGLNLGYTINVNLPATTDQAVYNAIFKSIKQNLLSDQDA